MLKKLIIAALLLGALGGGYAFYLFNMPHRDVQSESAFAELSVKQLMDEYAADAATAIDKYIDEEGESKVIIVSGLVDGITQDGRGQAVVRLIQEGVPVGVNCTFIQSEAEVTNTLNKGDLVKIKGFISSFGEYDADLDLADDSSLEKCSLIL